MQIRGLSYEQAVRIADELGIEYQGSDTSGPRKGVETSGVLRPKRGTPNPYQRVSVLRYGDDRQRRIYAVCWHGHRDFMRSAFAAGATRISTSFTTYYGGEDFERNYRYTGHRNVGSMMRPQSACDVCTCPDSGEAN